MRKKSGSAIKFGAATHVGRVRTGNEDAFIAEANVLGVADGMGGHQAGEVASAIAVQALRDRLGDGASSVEAAVSAVVDANSSIYSNAHNNVEQRGMGTTLTALVVLHDDEPGRKFVLINVGDSRTYLLRGGRLRRITEDHSYVQELVSSGHISEFEARSHPRRNIVTRALGIESTVRVDTWVLPFVKGDRYLLCSDGLVDEVDDRQIAKLLTSTKDPQRAAQALVDAANESGGRDNTTVVVVDVNEGEAATGDSADLDMELHWIDQPTGEIARIEFEADPVTEEIPVTAPAAAPRAKRHFGVGKFLFWLFIAVIVTGAVTLVLIVRDNAGSDPEPTPTTVTTVVTSTTVARTTTTTSGG